MGSTVDGLVSGLSTSSMISQLMQAESIGQTKLKSKVTSQQAQNTALQAINTKVAALKTATATAMDAVTWQSVKGSSSAPDAVNVSAAAGASTGQFTFDVTRLAKAHVRTAQVASTGSIQDGTGVKITIGATTTNITVTTDTAQGVAEAINKAGLDVRAAVLTTEQGSVLQLTATKTGAASAFTISGLQAPTTVVDQGTDAQLSVGTVGAGGYTVTSATNTFSNVLPNVSLTVNKLATGVTATVTQDVDALASKIQAMVDAANSLNSDISAKTLVGAGLTPGALAGNSMLRQIHSTVLSTVSAGKADYGSFKQLGVQLDRAGKLTFDKAAFVTGYQADPAKTKAAVTDTLAKGLNDIAIKANTDISSAIQTRDSTVRDLKKQIDNWDTRLTLRKQALERQYSNLEVSLGKMKQQSSWLAGQIASLG